MTIDEAIEKCKDTANTDANLHGYCMCPCNKCEQEHLQIAEWLEELNLLRLQNHLGRDEAFNAGRKQGYNKAIDDFAEKLNAKCDGMIRDKWNSNVAPISWAEAYADFKDDIDDIAEQLKAGGDNDD